jgi:hypothetical protein
VKKRFHFASGESSSRKGDTTLDSLAERGASATEAGGMSTRIA